MKILLVYPQHPETFWSFKHALKFVGKKSTFPPLGLLTVAAMLPKDWDLKLVDLNVEKLHDRDLAWADYVFLSAINIQRESVLSVLERCRRLGVKVVAGGPLFTTLHAEFTGIDHFVLNEAEITLPLFLADLARGEAKPIYRTEAHSDLSQTPMPRWDLIRANRYASMSIQYSRGCPFNCEFCDITLLYGQKSRVKSQAQILAELDLLHAAKWRGTVFFVDDNLIGNKHRLKTEILPAVSDWMTAHKRPFDFITQASINLADDPELLKMIVTAGFDSVFIGIESPNAESLAECLKTQNTRRDLIASIQKCQQAGLQVQGGFIVGFDSDPLSIFDQHIGFIQASGITTAMVGLLNAMKDTKLWHRLNSENRMLQASSGNNTDFSMNFIPKMNPQVLIDGYKRIVTQIYAPANYYARAKTFLKEFKMPPLRTFQLRPDLIVAFIRSIVRLGILGRERRHYWKLFFWSLFHRPESFALAIRLAINGFHFRKTFEAQLRNA